MGYWSVAQTQPFAERKAKRFLESQNFVCYLPRYQHTEHVRNIKRTRIDALFPRYLFVQIEDMWHAIKGTPGVSGILCDGGNKPIWVRDRIISELQSRERNGLIVLPEKEKFKKGQKVRITSGQFAGQLALYNGMSSRQRERVLLQLLGQYVPIELNIDSRIEAATTH